MAAEYAGSPIPPEDNYVSFIPQEGKEGQEFYKYERLILQMIVRYGEKIMCNATNEEGQEVPVSVIEYVINDLKQDELSFHNPLHRQILTEAATHIHDAGFSRALFSGTSGNNHQQAERGTYQQPLSVKQVPLKKPKDSNR